VEPVRGAIIIANHEKRERKFLKKRNRAVEYSLMYE